MYWVRDMAMRRADRLFELIQLLRRTRRAVTAAQLAETLEVAPRTVYRDIAALMAMRVPIVSSPAMRPAIASPARPRGSEGTGTPETGAASRTPFAWNKDPVLPTTHRENQRQHETRGGRRLTQNGGRGITNLRTYPRGADVPALGGRVDHRRAAMTVISTRVPGARAACTQARWGQLSGPPIHSHHSASISALCAMSVR